MLVQLREAREWSVQQAVNFSQKNHKGALTWNVLTRLESGKTKHPEAEALRALADLYELSYEDLAGRYVAANYGRDLPRHAGTGQGTANQGGQSDVATQARIRQLEGHLAVYKAILRKAHKLAREVAVITGRRREGSSALRAGAKRGGHH